MLTSEQLAELEALEREATPGNWGVWVEHTDTRAKAIAEFAELVVGTPKFAGHVVMVNAPGGLAPAVTGCGSESEKNAHLICSLRNAAPELIALAREALAERESAPGVMRVGWSDMCTEVLPITFHPPEAAALSVNEFVGQCALARAGIWGSYRLLITWSEGANGRLHTGEAAAA